MRLGLILSICYGQYKILTQEKLPRQILESAVDNAGFGSSRDLIMVKCRMLKRHLPCDTKELDFPYGSWQATAMNRFIDYDVESLS